MPPEKITQSPCWKITKSFWFHTINSYPWGKRNGYFLRRCFLVVETLLDSFFENDKEFSINLWTKDVCICEKFVCIGCNSSREKSRKAKFQQTNSSHLGSSLCILCKHSFWGVLFLQEMVRFPWISISFSWNFLFRASYPKKTGVLVSTNIIWMFFGWSDQLRVSNSWIHWKMQPHCIQHSPCHCTVSSIGKTRAPPAAAVRCLVHWAQVGRGSVQWEIYQYCNPSALCPGHTRKGPSGTSLNHKMADPRLLGTLPINGHRTIAISGATHMQKAAPQLVAPTRAHAHTGPVITWAMNNMEVLLVPHFFTPTIRTSGSLTGSSGNLKHNFFFDKTGTVTRFELASMETLHNSNIKTAAKQGFPEFSHLTPPRQDRQDLVLKILQFTPVNKKLEVFVSIFWVSEFSRFPKVSDQNPGSEPAGNKLQKQKKKEKKKKKSTKHEARSAKREARTARTSSCVTDRNPRKK